MTEQVIERLCERNLPEVVGNLSLRKSLHGDAKCLNQMFRRSHDANDTCCRRCQKYSADPSAAPDRPDVGECDWRSSMISAAPHHRGLNGPHLILDKQYMDGTRRAQGASTCPNKNPA
jgi:hypothetical protein